MVAFVCAAMHARRHSIAASSAAESFSLKCRLWRTSVLGSIKRAAHETARDQTLGSSGASLHLGQVRQRVAYCAPQGGSGVTAGLGEVRLRDGTYSVSLAGQTGCMPGIVHALLLLAGGMMFLFCSQSGWESIREQSGAPPHFKQCRRCQWQ